VGYGATYFLRINQNDVEKCPQKYAIFKVIRTWGRARRADAFPAHIKRLLQDASLSWRLEEGADGNSWTLYQMEDGRKVRSYELHGKL